MTSTRSAASSAATPFTHFAKVAMIAAAAWSGAMSQPAQAWPTGQVINGNVTFEHVGNTTIIRASDGSIINYFNFSIAPNEIVQFIQPGEMARVLNRVTGPDPTIIAGTLLANGQVYIVNPAGVYFHNGAVVDVAGLYAAAGSLSNARFLAGNNTFTNLSGSVVNDGTINGKNINLIGQNVANHGTINGTDGGVIVMAAGDKVYVGQQGGKILLRVDGVKLTDQAAPQSGHTTPDVNAMPGVENTGTINANHGAIALGAGDMYALAVRNSGTISAAGGNVTVAAADGLVENTATGHISADVDSGVAGQVTVQGPSVLNAGAITADANQGQAGRVAVTSQNHTYLVNGSVISASGGDGNAAGGQVLVNSYNGITAMGSGAQVNVSGGSAGGNGGFAEVSGRRLAFSGFSDLSAKAGYKRGTLLLDPLNLIVNADGGFDVSSGTVNFGDPDAATNVFISAAALQALTGDILLQATGDISIFHDLDFSAHNNNLTLEAYNNIFVFNAITGANNLVFTADWDGNGVGDLHLAAPMNWTGNGMFSAVTTFIETPALTSLGGQSYYGAVRVCDEVTLTGSDVHFHGFVDSRLPNEHSLTVNIGSGTDGGVFGQAWFDDAVGFFAPLTSLTVNGPSHIAAPMIITQDFQRYFGPVTLADDSSLISTDDGEIHFAGSIDGAHSLYVQTGGLTRFDGTVGGNERLEAVVTDAAGQTQIGADMHAQSLLYGDPVSLAASVAIIGDTEVEFGQTVAGNSHSMIVNSPLTYFRGDATGFDLLQTDAAGTTYIGPNGEIFTFGPLMPILISGNQLDFNDHVVLLWNAIFSGIQFVDFDKTLNGAWDCVTDSDGYVRFGGDVGGVEALASLTTNVASPSVIDRNLVLIDGNLVRVSGDINFNPGGRVSPAQVATIAARNLGGVTIQSLNGNILMGANEKLTSLGNLTLQALNGYMVLNDLNANGDMNIFSPDIRLMTRGGGPILDSNGNFISDNAVAFIATGSIFFSSSPTVLGGGNSPIFAFGSGGSVSNNLLAFDHRTFSSLTGTKFTYGDIVLDLAPPLDLFPDLIDQTTGPTQIKDRVILDPIVSQSLGNLAINSRPLGNDELLGTTDGRYLQNDMFSKPPKGTPDDHSVAANRLRRDSILKSLTAHSSLYFSEETDPQTGEVKKSDKTHAVRDALNKAWKSYLARENATDNLNGQEFLAFLKDNPDQQEAYQYFNDLQTLVTQLKISGMTAIELGNSLNAVLPNVKPSDLSDAQFKQLLGIETL